MTDKTYNVLFLCTGNSARSVIAECIMNRLGAGRITAYSAGSHPAGTVNPHALALLRGLNYPVDGLRSKNWDEFAGPDAPPLDFIFTVCDNAAGEVCPVWPGRPMTAHWGLPDPAAVGGGDAEIGAAFAETHRELYNRISTFNSLELEALDQPTLRKWLDDIGASRPASA